MDLVEVRFPAAGTFVCVPPGTTLLAAAELAGVEIVTGCTRGMCGTDAVRVAVGRDDALEPPSETEQGTLERMGVPAGCRLACSARVRVGPIEVLGDAVLDGPVAHDG
ncbi:MAG: (2Fe-2S)-binding protein [Planctomycetes bacterium]|nr:(2Fe-2S)-binding protein [Planctomycetota bacterium]